MRYRSGGLIRPARKNNRRFYSAHDLKWISCVRYMIHEKGVNQEGLRRLLGLTPCADIKNCPPEQRATCRAIMNRSTPCWDLARQHGWEGQRCYECEVYLSAASRILSPGEIEAAFSYTAPE
jgi:MerR family transcriptional regulator/heat shock protein HspR